MHSAAVDFQLLCVNDEFRGVAMISGLPHLEDHRNLVEVMDQFCAQKNA